MNFTPWPFQDVVINDVVNYVRSHKDKPLSGYVTSPTGTGKSLMIAHAVYKIGKPIMVLQPSKELLEQNYNKFANYGGLATIYSASAGSKQSSTCTFATPGSVYKYGELFRRYHGVEYLFIDECHHKVKVGRDDGDGQVRKFIQDLQPKVIVGWTASPVRLVSGGGGQLQMLQRNRDKIFEDVISTVQIKDIYEKYWKAIEYKLYDFDESKLITNSTGTDYTEDSIRVAIQANNVNNNICLEIVKQVNAGKKAILVFCDSVDNGHRISEWLNKRDINSSCVDGKTAKKVRETNVNRFLSGEDLVLINHSTFTTGFDYPGLDCVMLGRPTKSFSLLYQKIGRLVRKHEIVLSGLCIDFCNNIKRLGYIHDITFEKVPGYGWGMFNKDVLKSGRPLDFPPIKKTDLILHAQADKKTMAYEWIHFGKHRGKHLSEIPIDYLLYCQKELEFKGEYMNKFKNALLEELEKRVSVL